MTTTRRTRPRIVLVTPATAAANNGNWQTATRWARHLADVAEVDLCQAWNGQPADAMIALHARRSAEAVAAWHAARSGPAALPGATAPLLLVLTGTDLYRDIQHDASAQRSLDIADRLVVLNRQGALSLPPQHRAKCRVLLQSCSARRTPAKTGRHLRAVMVGHLREEKDPRTYLHAAERLAPRRDILLDHIGDAIDPALGALAQQRAAAQPNYRWLGGLPHARTRDRIQAAHVLVHTSRMEGGAHVVMEALRSGTPVLASRIDGNVGLLGTDYPAFIEPGDAEALADWLRRLRDEPALLADLAQRAARLAPAFSPAHERDTLRALLAELLALVGGVSARPAAAG